ncbi:type 1 glutamine amidotransferase [Sulfurisphaera ohwakuensis]|uniref:type 1 glutamine amidotransferase n=1 Tax=Sulfurisphaera ohwakuensis TaxID=69656 RepID=UPI0036F42ADF
MFLGIINHPIERLGNIKDILEEKGYKIRETLATEIRGNEEFDALIVMGGPMGVYESDKYPFLKVESELIRKAISTKKPVLGVCLGSQLLSSSLRGTVTRGVFGQEIGIYTVYLLDEFRNLMGDKIEVFQWHGDTFTLPNNAKLLAYNERYFQAFKYKTAIGLQFHVEVNSKMVSEWVKEYNGDPSLIDQVKEKEEEFRKISEKIISFWLDSVRGSQ